MDLQMFARGIFNYARAGCMIWVRNYIRIKFWVVITQPRLTSTAESPLKLDMDE